jgi:predicted aldo/keto reductase-like oxidoreductase
MLRQALAWGVTYWDTADCYQSGSETGIGKYFAKYPHDREKVFLVSKSDARDPDGMSRLLDRSLERMNTSYLDLYFVHGVRDIDELNDATRRWAEEAKARKKIRLFGFSTHRNMEELLSQAPKLGYIDGIMMTYNFRNMDTAKMKAAVAACTKAGIGLTAMKTMADRSWLGLGSADKTKEKLMASITQKGFTEEQAKLKAVWTSPHIAAICSQMPNMTILKANVAAAVDDTPLSSKEMRLFRQYAAATADQYCAGCGDICEAAVGGKVPIGDIMRYHMYCQSYGHLDWARAHFQQLPPRVKQRLREVDFTDAQRRCPQKMPIARLMRRAARDFG